MIAQRVIQYVKTIYSTYVCGIYIDIIINGLRLLHTPLMRNRETNIVRKRSKILYMMYVSGNLIRYSVLASCIFGF